MFLKITEKNRKWWVLAAMASCISLIFIDLTVLPVALPTIHRQLNISDLGLQWVVNAYLLSLTVLVLAGGRISDMFGHRKIFCYGIVLFAVSSAMCGMSFSAWWFIMSRTLQGLGGALLLPSTASILLATFPLRERGKAMGLYVSLGSIFLGFGPFIGGFFTEYLSWRFVFWINIPIAVIGFCLALASVPPSEKRKETFDYIGFLTLGAGVTLLIVALMQGGEWGWSSAETITMILAGIVLIALLITIDRKIEHPFVDFTIFKDKIFLVTNCCVFLTQFLLMVTVFWAVYFQNILNFSPVLAGTLAFLANVPVIIFAPIGGYLVDRFGPKPPVALGFLLVILSVVLFIFIVNSANLWLLLLALLPFGCGIPMIFTPSFVAMMSTVAPHKRGIASGINTTLRQFGSTLGMAVIGAMFLNFQKSLFSENLKKNALSEALDPNQFDGLLAHRPTALETISSLSGDTRVLVEQFFTHAYIEAFSIINIFAICIAALGLIVAIFFLQSHLNRSTVDEKD
jgi:EmrB/QacA subfamily drug resistance transporter